MGPAGRPARPMEDHRAALKREVREETGLSRRGRRASARASVRGGASARAFRAHPALRLPTVGCARLALSHEHLEARWLPVEQLADVVAGRRLPACYRARDPPGDRPAAFAELPRGLNLEKAVVCCGGAQPQLVPGIEGAQGVGQRQPVSGAPARLTHGDGAVALGRPRSPRPRAWQDRRQPAREVAGAGKVAALDVGRQVRASRAVSSWNCRPTRRATRPSSASASAGPAAPAGWAAWCAGTRRHRRGRCAGGVPRASSSVASLGWRPSRRAAFAPRRRRSARARPRPAAGRSRSSSLRGPACRRPSCRCRRSPGRGLPSDTPLCPCQPCSMAADTACGTAAIAVPRQIQRGGG